MHDLALKLILTPALIALASLAGRRWGPVVSGWLVGLPFTSGPVILFLALNHGASFAATAAAGTLAGTVSQAAFSLGYGWVSLRYGLIPAVLAATLAFASLTALLQRLDLTLLVSFAAVILALLAALRLLPHIPPPAAPPPPPHWDLPLRMVVATCFVLLLTAVAPTLGPQLSGLLAPFPLYAGILAVFAHRLAGPAAAIGVLRGLLLGLFAFATFFLLVGALLVPAGIAPAFAAALAAALTLQGASLWLIRRSTSSPIPPPSS